MSSNLAQIKTLLEKYNLAPRKTLGQTFLIDQNIIDNLIKAVKIEQGDAVLEIGPGLGTITKTLSENCKKIIAVEKDEKFTEILRDLQIKNVEIVEADILNYIKQNDISKYKIVANIPYRLTTFLIRNLLENANQPKEIYLIIQREAAERICAKEKKNILALSVQYYATPELCFKISKNSFWPKPKVESALIKIIPSKKYSEEDKIFFQLIKMGFSSPRKKLINNLTGNYKKAFLKTELNENIRAEDLKLEDWKKIIQEID